MGCQSIVPKIQHGYKVEMPNSAYQQSRTSLSNENIDDVFISLQSIIEIISETRMSSANNENPLVAIFKDD